ncbi:MAG: DUF4430 domain-containing protein [Candidatus Magasanikbacteria bacterium]|nr:DUF4430 domain-containing protein [Candidatus Magasanikbacteria bacterium]
MRDFHQKHKIYYILLGFFGILALTSGVLGFNSSAPNFFSKKIYALQENGIEIQDTSEKTAKNNKDTALEETDTDKQKYQNNAKALNPKAAANEKTSDAQTNSNYAADTAPRSQRDDAPFTETPEKEAKSSETKHFTLKIKEENYEMDVGVNASLYEAMNETAQKNPGFTFTSKNFGPGLGFFIESINELSNNTKEKQYWIYYINGVKAQIGVSAYHIKQDDIIEWNYEKEE